jgi:hypothetical protein
MKTIERILMKVVLIQFLLLLVFQFILHHSTAFSQFEQLTKYEGVSKGTHTIITETFSKK